jgi:multiple sugar transport system permease protein
MVRKTGRYATTIALYVANFLVLLFLLFPILAVLQGSVMSERTTYEHVNDLVPRAITLENYAVVLVPGFKRELDVTGNRTYIPRSIEKFYRAFGNSLAIAVSVTVLTLLAGSLSAYSVARLKTRWATWLLGGSLIMRFLPVMVLVIPMYVIGRTIGVTDSMLGVILAESGLLLPYAIFILVPFFQSIPGELEEAARVDGCTRLGALFRVILPLATPGLAAVGVIVFVASWHELLIPLVLNNRPDSLTLPMVMASLVGDVQVLFNITMAVAVLSLLPTVILVIVLQKYVVQGLAAGAVKG